MSRQVEPLRINDILKWADQHHELTGRWPMSRSGPVIGHGDITWEAINTALQKGCRGLPGGTSLYKLLVKHRGIKDPRRLRPDLTRKQIVEWAREHYMRTGHWPTRDSGRVPSAPDITWSTIYHALRKGGTNLPGGQRLTDLLRREFSIWSSRGHRPLTYSLILKWADEHYAQHGRWPAVLSGKVLRQPRETWAAINEALKHGRRGLPGGMSLKRLLMQHRGHLYNPKLVQLSEAQIRSWARQYHQVHRRWPTAKSGRCSACGLSWWMIDRCLRQGGQGLTGGSSLSKLLHNVSDNGLGPQQQPESPLKPAAIQPYGITAPPFELPQIELITAHSEIKSAASEGDSAAASNIVSGAEACS